MAVVSPPAGFSLNNLPSSKRCSAAQNRPNTVTAANQNIVPGVHNVETDILIPFFLYEIQYVLTNPLGFSL